MRNLDGYISMMKWFYALAGFCLAVGFTLFFPLLAVYGVLLAIMGFTQIVEGIAFTVMRAKPQWFLRSLCGYWVMTLLYFLVMAWMINQGMTHQREFTLWAFVAPWTIAIYQYWIVYRLRNYNETKMQESLWEAEQIEKDLKKQLI